jgi:Uncharacterised nucleotidyltransferase
MHVDAKAWARPGVWASHVTALRVLETVVPVFEKAGIPTLAVKGVVTAHTLYGDPAERPIGDVDLRIRPEDFRRAMRVAEDAGWEIVERKPAYGAFGMFVGGLGVGVDVESVVGAPGMCGLSIAEMLGRAEWRDFGGVRVRVPEVHDHAVLMCVNLFKDKMVLALPWAVEDARRIVGAEGFEVGVFLGRAQGAKVAGMAWIVADWMGERGGMGWEAVKMGLGGKKAPRPHYSFAFQWLSKRRPSSYPMRLLARLGADDLGILRGFRALRDATSFEWTKRRDQSQRVPPDTR